MCMKWKGTGHRGPRRQNVQEERRLRPEGNFFGKCRMHAKSESALFPPLWPEGTHRRAVHSEKRCMENAWRTVRHSSQVLVRSQKKGTRALWVSAGLHVLKGDKWTYLTCGGPSAPLRAHHSYKEIRRRSLVGLSHATTPLTSQMPPKELVLKVPKSPKRVIKLLESLCPRLYRDF